jgi:hypothetical protein
MDFEHGAVQRVYGEYYATAQTVPANTNADGDEGAQKNSGAMGGIAVTAVAATDVFITDACTLTIKVQHCATEGGSYVDLGNVCAKLSSGDTTYEAGEVLGRFILPPEIEEWTKVNLATDDASATGTIDVFPEMIPR